MEDFEPTPEQLAEQKQSRKRLRERAKKYLKRFRGQLPKLSPSQAALIVKMLMTAYAAGEDEMSMEWGWRETAAAQIAHEKRVASANRGVAARRKKSRRWAIRADFEAGLKAGKVAAVKHLANKHGTSLATAYRAVDDLLKRSKS